MVLLLVLTMKISKTIDPWMNRDKVALQCMVVRVYTLPGKVESFLPVRLVRMDEWISFESRVKAWRDDCSSKSMVPKSIGTMSSRSARRRTERDETDSSHLMAVKHASSDGTKMNTSTALPMLSKSEYLESKVKCHKL